MHVQGYVHSQGCAHAQERPEKALSSHSGYPRALYKQKGKTKAELINCLADC